MSTGAPRETAFAFICQGVELPAILHHGAPWVRRGVLVIVGGPQYRVGSHRQFVLLARALAANGTPVMRFDYRGMGDAGGDDVGFERVNDDIHAAVDAFTERMPALREVVLWGLCDAASAALFYAASDRRVTGLVLLNPWVRTEQGEAKAYLTHYYRGRVLSGVTWKRLLCGEIPVLAAAGSIVALLRRVLADKGTAGNESSSLPQRMLNGLQAFGGRTLLVLSGKDLTAAEFLSVVNGSAKWQAALADERVTRLELPRANHTFSSRVDRDAVALATLEWLTAQSDAGERL